MAGLIPAHAGKTCCGRRRRPCRRAHPRSRGENTSYTLTLPNHLGSSPLTRGKLSTSVHVRYAIGLIPAHAGKTSRPKLCRGSKRAHPRSRGENLAVPYGVEIELG